MIFLLILVSFLGLSLLRLVFVSQNLVPCPCPLTSFPTLLPPPNSHLSLASLSTKNQEPVVLSRSATVPLPAHAVSRNMTKEEAEFWAQPDGEGYRPCLDFSILYRKASAKISKEKHRFLVVVVSGGLNQQKNQIVDAVVIARILEAALVVPVLEINQIWKDESEFSDIFDVDHFKRTLQADVRVVSSLPSTHLSSKPTINTRMPLNVSPLWIRTKFLTELNKEGVLILKGIDSKLSKNLPLDLQKLRCKVAFHALRFAAPIQELGDRFARRMWIEGPYIALHLRLEKDVWVRTGCLTGLGPKYDDIIRKIRESRPRLLTGRLNMTYTQRRLAGLCPLNALEVARGSEDCTSVQGRRRAIWGAKALQALVGEFPNVVTKEMLAREGELSPYVNRPSAMAALDYIVSLSSDVFLPSHGGNMGRAMQGHRAYVGHRKFVKPDKREMIPFFEDASISEAEFRSIMRKLHSRYQGQPEKRTNKRSTRDVIAYPMPECMCRHSNRPLLRS
ncbi:O-fucosyltransferase 37 [Vitis vinifera]|uniref:O-fucosyltransferase family protein n=1 Tax=Vitis vinifera TaxID=29760 RepID=A0A438EYV5_VITVI|nr:O-fucosyltransferase 37 [Vitis vinifera]